MASVQVHNLHSKLSSLPMADITRQFLNYLTVEAGLSENTILAYGRDLLSFAKFCQSHRINSLPQVQPEVIYRYLQFMAGKRTIADTINEAIAAVESVGQRILKVSTAVFGRFLKATRMALVRVWTRYGGGEQPCQREDDAEINRAMGAVKGTSRRFLDVSMAALARFLQATRAVLSRVWRARGKIGDRSKSEASINRALVAVKMLLRYAKMEGLVEDDFSSVLEGAKPWQKLPMIYSQQDVIKLLKAPCPADRFYHRDKAILELLYATGVRASELAGLKISDLNVKIGYLRCLGKGNRERVIPVGKAAIAATVEYLHELRPRLAKEFSGDFLLLSRTGRPMGRIEIWRLVKKYALRAGMPANLSVHTLRHCFASHLLAGGADLRSVQEMLGHVDIVTTQIYTHVDQQRLRKIHKQFHPRP